MTYGRANLQDVPGALNVHIFFLNNMPYRKTLQETVLFK